MKKYKRLLVALSLIISCNLMAQERIDTIYYDKDWKGVTNISFADFYRIAIYPENKNYKKQFRDFFITGELQATGGFISINHFNDSKSVFDGECIIYFKNGKISSKKNYSDGKLNGEFSEHTEDGLISKTGKFQNGKLSGLYTEFLENGTYSQAEYVNGEPKYWYFIMSNADGYTQKINFKDKTPIWESPSVNERKVEYRNGIPWQYYIKNGLCIAQINSTINDYGKWHRVDLIIFNNSTMPIDFDPSQITAYSADKKVKITFLAVLSSDQYMKKVKRTQTWNAVAVGLSEGLATMNAGYSSSTTTSSAHYSGRSNSSGSASAYGSGGYAYGSYASNSTSSGSVYGKSTTTTYDAAAAYQTRVLSSQRMANFENAQWEERQAKDEGYLKRTTIYPGETITGYVHIERKSGIAVVITVSINGADYRYSWSYGK